MRKVDVLFEISKDKNYWCFTREPIGANSFQGCGKSVRDSIKSLLEGKDIAKDEGGFEDFEMNFIFDVASFFNYYSLDPVLFAANNGMSKSVLVDYVNGRRTPNERSIGKIRSALSKTMPNAVESLITKPIVKYL